MSKVMTMKWAVLSCFLRFQAEQYVLVAGVEYG